MHFHGDKLDRSTRNSTDVVLAHTHTHTHTHTLTTVVTSSILRFIGITLRSSIVMPIWLQWNAHCFYFVAGFFANVHRTFSTNWWRRNSNVVPRDRSERRRRNAGKENVSERNAIRVWRRRYGTRRRRWNSTWRRTTETGARCRRWCWPRRRTTVRSSPTRSAGESSAKSGETAYYDRQADFSYTVSRTVAMHSKTSPSHAIWPMRQADLRVDRSQPVTSQSCETTDGHGASVSHGVPVYSQAYAGTELYCIVTKANVCEWRGCTRQLSGWDWTRDFPSTI